MKFSHRFSRWRNMEKCTWLFIYKCFFHPRRASEKNVFCGETRSSKRAQKIARKTYSFPSELGKWQRKVCSLDFLLAHELNHKKFFVFQFSAEQEGWRNSYVSSGSP